MGPRTLSGCPELIRLRGVDSKNTDWWYIYQMQFINLKKGIYPSHNGSACACLPGLPCFFPIISHRLTHWRPHPLLWLQQPSGRWPRSVSQNLWLEFQTHESSCPRIYPQISGVQRIQTELVGLKASHHKVAVRAQTLARLPRLRFSLHGLLAVRRQASYSVSLCFGFLVWKMKVIRWLSHWIVTRIKMSLLTHSKSYKSTSFYYYIPFKCCYWSVCCQLDSRKLHQK